MPDAAITADVHQSLDVHLRLTPERAFHLVIGGDNAADLGDFLIVQVADLLVKRDPRLLQNAARRCPPDPEDVRQADLGTLLFR